MKKTLIFIVAIAALFVLQSCKGRADAEMTNTLLGYWTYEKAIFCDDDVQIIQKAYLHLYKDTATNECLFEEFTVGKFEYFFKSRPQDITSESTVSGSWEVVDGHVLFHYHLPSFDLATDFDNLRGCEEIHKFAYNQVRQDYQSMRDLEVVEIGDAMFKSAKPDFVEASRSDEESFLSVRNWGILAESQMFSESAALGIY